MAPTKQKNTSTTSKSGGGSRPPQGISKAVPKAVLKDKKRRQFLEKRRKLRENKAAKKSEEEKCADALKKVQDLQKDENKGNADLKEQVKELESQLAGLRAALTEFEDQENELETEENVIDAMNIGEEYAGGGAGRAWGESGDDDEDTGTQSNPVVLSDFETPTQRVRFAPGTDGGWGGSAGPGGLFVLDSDEEELGAPLYSRSQSTSRDGVEMKVVGWKQSGYTKQYNVMYGPRNAAKYRLEPSSEVSVDYDEKEEEDIGNPENRNGEKKVGRKYVYAKRHVFDIYGVAWKRNPGDDLDLINPDISRDRYTATSVLIAWVKDGRPKELKWETRSTLRNRWGQNTADRAIFEAAQEAEDRFDEYKRGIRRSEDRSPTPGRSAIRAREFRDQSSEEDDRRSHGFKE